MFQAKPVTKFTQTQYSNYNEVKRVMMDTYPHVIKPDNPLPLSDAAIKKMANNPYLRNTDEEIADFFTVWQCRREYAINICMYQSYYCEAGNFAGKIPARIVADRSYQVAKFAKTMDLTVNNWNKS